MALINEALPTHADLSREYFLERWFADDTQSQLKIAALNYLGDAGNPTDLPTIKTELSRNDYQTRTAALDAIVRINLREGREKALQELFELQTDIVSDRVIKRLFDKPESISDDTLTKGIGQRSDIIRRACVALLAKRKKLTSEMAEKLLVDGDAEVRFVALATLMKLGRSLSQEEAEKILVRPSGGLLGTTGTEVGEPQFSLFKELTFAGKSEQQLREIANRATIFNRDAEFALFDKRYSKDRAKLLALVDDRYKTAFATELAEMKTRYGEDDPFIKETTALEDFVRKRFVRQGLNIVARKGGAGDLAFMRKNLVDDFGYSIADTEYFAKHGEWQDIPLIISMLGRYQTGVTILGGGSTNKARLAANAIHRIAKGRITEMLAITMPSELLGRIIDLLSESEFRGIDNRQIQQLLLSQDERVRKITVLRSIKNYSKVRLKQTLEDYVSNAQRYYNVIHWLDMGLSVPKELSAPAVVKTIARIWE